MTREEFKGLFDEQFDAIRSYLYYRSGDKELATDLAQEAFMKLWEKDIALEGKKTIGLVYKIASDLFVSRYRRTVVEANYVGAFTGDKSDDQSPEDQMAYEELKRNYETALSALPEKQRTVFLMSRVDELSYKEIAERLDLSVKAIEKRMHIALSFFKDKLLSRE